MQDISAECTVGVAALLMKQTGINERQELKKVWVNLTYVDFLGTSNRNSAVMSHFSYITRRPCVNSRINAVRLR